MKCLSPYCESCNPPDDHFFCDEHEVYYHEDELCPECEEEEGE